MPERSSDWFKQAARDLESAKAQAKDGFFEWSCFIAQQAAEKAVKAIYQKLGAEAWGHSVRDLFKGLSKKIKITTTLLESARDLDKFYIPARYPNGWASGTPSEYLSRKDAQDAISNSKRILRFCKGILVK
ncbi:MAG: DNA-binding protein [Omnitrophica WOR_2 bacterium RIFCSPHIGHO2_02_FULL_46_37]|nr:MAG: DNA-binding protein [Omnitrophica WOR_2 bacterium RIFCSPHIGHO2_02_FULL_46_37]OGX42521.1 MAG: DNA-binding protein [Omnitrophica WOR_2 bacterium RIFCSPLOWO2_02_FULL_45_28]